MSIEQTIVGSGGVGPWIFIYIWTSLELYNPKKDLAKPQSQIPVTCTLWKKVSGFPVPCRDVTYQSLPARESFVSDIPAGDGKTANPFLQWTVTISKREY